MEADHCPVPESYRDQIGRKYRSPHESGYQRRSSLVSAFAEELIARDERVTQAKVAAMLGSLGRGYAINTKTLSLDMAAVRRRFRVAAHANGHRVKVEDGNETRIYDSLRKAAEGEGCSKEAMRQWITQPGRANKRGLLCSYMDAPEERPKPNRR